jgi:periplasmic protein TonB
MSILARCTAALVVLAALVAGAWFLLHDDVPPPRKVNEITVVTIVPPLPPPPPPPEQQRTIEETKQPEFKEEKPLEKPAEEPQKETYNKDDQPPAAILPGAEQAGPGDYRGNGKNLPGGGPGGGSKWAAYRDMLTAQIEAALQSNKKTRSSALRIEVRLWADALGRISRVQLARSTGDAELDAAIRDEVLGQLTLREPPPKDMPMPILTRITGRRSS